MKCFTHEMVGERYGGSAENCSSRETAGRFRLENVGTTLRPGEVVIGCWMGSPM